MGNETLTRRNFFSKLGAAKKSNDQNGDPLFNKYSRKTSGRLKGNGESEMFTRGAEPQATSEAFRINPVSSGLAPYTGPWTEKEAAHLLRRTTYGVKQTDVANAVNNGFTATVNAVLNTGSQPALQPVNWYNNIIADTGGVAYGADWSASAFATYTGENQTVNTYRSEGLRALLWGKALNQNSNIYEKMMMFWYHFIPVDFDTVTESNNTGASTNSARVLLKYMQMFRDFATGNYKTMIRQMATEPSMMFYLNNQANTNTAPDENFARELMELFTLGKDPASQYTQADVIQAAKVLTGWRVQNLTSHPTTTAFQSNRHSTGNKQFSPFFNTTIAGTGAEELDALINMIFSKQQVVSEYICRRLYRFFVYYDIDQHIETNVIVPLAQHFVASNWEILPVLDKLFKSEHFYDAANSGVFIKTPTDVIAGTFRTFGITADVSDSSNYHAQYEVWRYINNTIAKPMEQHMGYVPNVSGWNAFYQPPAYHQYWINTNTIQKRFAFIDRLFTTNGYNLTYNTLNVKLKIDSLAWVQQTFSNAIAGEPNNLIVACIRLLLPVEISQEKRDEIKRQTLLYQQDTDQYWINAWTNYIGTPANAMYKSIVTDRTKSLLYTILQLAEYQLM